MPTFMLLLTSAIDSAAQTYEAMGMVDTEETVAASILVVGSPIGILSTIFFAAVMVLVPQSPQVARLHIFSIDVGYPTFTAKACEGAESFCVLFGMWV